MTLPQIERQLRFFKVHPPAFVLLEKIAGYKPPPEEVVSDVKSGDDVTELVTNMPGVGITHGN